LQTPPARTPSPPILQANIGAIDRAQALLLRLSPGNCHIDTTSRLRGFVQLRLGEAQRAVQPQPPQRFTKPLSLIGSERLLDSGELLTSALLPPYFPSGSFFTWQTAAVSGGP